MPHLKSRSEDKKRYTINKDVNFKKFIDVALSIIAIISSMTQWCPQNSVEIDLQIFKNPTIFESIRSRSNIERMFDR